MKKKKEEEKKSPKEEIEEEIEDEPKEKLNRQVQIQKPNIQIVLSSDDSREDMDFLLDRAMGIIDYLKDK